MYFGCWHRLLLVDRTGVLAYCHGASPPETGSPNDLARTFPLPQQRFRKIINRMIVLHRARLWRSLELFGGCEVLIRRRADHRRLLFPGELSYLIITMFPPNSFAP